MDKCKEAESMVYLQTSNEIKHSLSDSIKRRRFTEDSSLGWYNLDKRKPVKEYRRAEFDDYITKADSSKCFPAMDGLEHRRHEEAMVCDLEFEVQELQSSEDSGSDEVWQISDGVKRKKLKLKGELKTHHDQKIFNMNLKDQSRDKMDEKTGKYSTFELNIDQQDATETALLDVHLTVQASYRAENVPFVCLTSQLNGNAIMGYPLEIEKLSDVCDMLLPRKAKVDPMFFNEERIRFCRLVWKTAKRTPVYYVPKPLSSPVSDNVPAGNSSITEDSIIADKENGKENSLAKLVKDPKKSNEGKEAKIGGCVPVGLVFSKILTAVGQLQS